MKRAHSEAERQSSQKRQKPEESLQYQNAPRSSFSNSQSLASANATRERFSERAEASIVFYEDALGQLPPPKRNFPPVAPHTPFTVAPGLPPLPPITNPSLETAPFTHKSSIASYNRSAGAASEKTYEQLEFLGDAYIELFASRLLFSRYAHLTVGHQSQVRELLVKNETLAEFSRAYGFDQRIETAQLDHMVANGKQKGNKGMNKVLGDVFEAYVAAVILSDEGRGNGDASAAVEKWLTALWAPKLVEYAKKDRMSIPTDTLIHSAHTNDAETYDPSAKDTLTRRIHPGDSSVKIEYKRIRDSVELKGDQLGLNKHFIGVFLSGWGYGEKLLGEGEGKNKVEAGNWAATKAMHGESKPIVEACEKELQALRSEKKRKKHEELLAKIKSRENEQARDDKAEKGKSTEGIE